MNYKQPMAHIVTKNNGRKKGFTLVELLVVMAISVIILGLLFGPIIQGLNLSSRTRAMVGAQDAARFGLERITRELSQATFVFDNSVTPIVLPFGALDDTPTVAGRTVIKRDRRGNGPVEVTNVAGYRPGDVPFLFAKVDFIPAETESGLNNQQDVQDPTTGRNVLGTERRFPLAPGTRLVRYWIGLRNNLPNASGNPAIYQNVYEFGSDSGYNPFILYRAEFDPSDRRLINQDPNEKYGSTLNAGGLNDPNFYNTRAAEGGTYAQNWRDIASPFVSAQNLDMIAWTRGDNRQILPSANPFRPTVSFSPGTIVGDTAGPGFLTDPGNEVPGAVPSVYTAQHGQWVLPYTVTFYRFASRNRATDPRYGVLRVQVRRENDGLIRAALLDSDSSLRSTQTDQQTADFAYAFGRRGGLFVKTRGVTYFVDPLRGRVITGFPPLAGNNGVPLFDANGDGTADSVPPGGIGDPIQTVFRLNTLHARAGIDGRPKFSGILEARLNPEGEDSPEPFSYYPAFPVAQVPQPGAVGTYASPFSLFGPALIAPGSERVLGPDNDPDNDNDPNNPDLSPYYRVSNLTPLGRRDSGIVNDPTDGTPYFSGNPLGPLNYKLEIDLRPKNPKIVFDDTASTVPPPQGLPVKRFDDELQKEVQITYLWQNNYAREVIGTADNAEEVGYPVDVDGDTIFDNRGRAIRPEPDVVKVDYSTRSLMNVRLGVRVYDASSGQPQGIEVTDRVRINNVGR